MTTPVEGFLAPARDPDAEAFWDALDRGRLLVSVCDACGKRWFPPLATCPRCSARAVRSEPASASGSLYTWTVIHRAADPAYAQATPYAVGLVELDDGARLYGRLVGIEPSALHDGLRLDVEVIRVDGAPIWCFTRADR